MKKLILLSIIASFFALLFSCKKDKPEVYFVKLNQESINAPVVYEQINDLKTVTWKRNAQGIYQGDFSEFLTGNYFVEISQSSDVNSDVRAHLNNEYVQVYTRKNGEFSDDVLKDIALKITVYK